MPATADMIKKILRKGKQEHPEGLHTSLNFIRLLRVTSSRYYSLSNLRGENDSKQSDEFQATWTQVIQVFDVPTLAIVNRQHNTVGS